MGYLRAAMIAEGRFRPSAVRGRLAQLVRAPALQAGSRGFESLTAHHLSIFESVVSIAASALGYAMQRGGLERKGCN
jgi:hypothetical protein